MRKNILPQEALKLIACITMLIDHFGAAIVPYLRVPYAADLYYACRMIGRLAFPIYCFLLAEGMRHTRNPISYIGRLAIGILLAELPFDLLFEGGWSWAYQSVMVTLTLGAIMLLCMQKTEKKILKLLLVLPFAVLAELCKCDYGGWGAAMIAVFAILENIHLQFFGVLMVGILMPSGGVPIFGTVLPCELAAIFAMLPIGYYSGKKLTHSRAVQWVFYLFYPLHILILWLILRTIR